MRSSSLNIGSNIWCWALRTEASHGKQILYVGRFLPILEYQSKQDEIF